MTNNPAALPRPLLPDGWHRPRGYSNAMIGRGTLIVTGGVVGWDAQEVFAEGFAAQCRQCFANIREILLAGGAGPEHLVRLTWYVTDIDAYAINLREIGQAYREEIGTVYPAMAVIGVSRLVEAKALVEIEAMAILP